MHFTLFRLTKFSPVWLLNPGLLGVFFKLQYLGDCLRLSVKIWNICGLQYERSEDDNIYSLVSQYCIKCNLIKN